MDIDRGHKTMTFEVYPEYSPCSRKLDLYIFANYHDGSRAICTSLERMIFTKYDESVSDNKPTLSINEHISKPFLQAMADALDKIGIRATGKPILENELTATKYHLEDMRKLVFFYHQEVKDAE
jgi:hypothetical protein